MVMHTEINITNRITEIKHDKYNKQSKETEENLSHFLRKIFRLLIICNGSHYQHIVHNKQYFSVLFRGC